MSETRPAQPPTTDDVTRSYAGTVVDSPASPSLPATPDVPGYEILSELGRGGMGVVYLARQTALKRLVALKMIRAALASPGERARFRAEAEAVGRLNHPHIVQVYEVGECPAGPFVALEYVTGGSLDHRLKRASLETHDAARFLMRLARAVQVAHEKGIVHRDLKPGNVLLSPDPDTANAEANGSSFVPKVTDFGLAKFLDDLGPDLTREGAVLGTPSYMAPEQASGQARDVGPEADIYALGAILYECLTGRPPFRGATVRETIELVCKNDPIPVRQSRPGVPRDLETICLKCLHKVPGRRYASAAHLADDLERFLDGRPITARPIGRFERAVKWARRRPTLFALLAVLAVAGIASIVATVLVIQRLEWDRLDALEKERLADSALKALKASTAREREAEAETLRQIRHTLLQKKTALGVFNLGEAFRSLANFQATDTDRFLNTVDEDVRGWEWRFLRERLNRTPQHVPGASSCVAFHPTADLCAAGSDTGEVRLLALPSGSPVGTWSWHNAPLRRLAFARGGTLLALGAADGLLIVGDVGTGEELFRLQCQPRDTELLAFAPDGNLLALRGGTTGVRLIECPGGRERPPVNVHQGEVKALGFLPGGTRVVSASSTGEVKVWDADTGTVAAPLENGGFIGPVGCGASDPVRGRIAVADRFRNLVVWDATTGKVLWKYPTSVSTWINRLAFSPDGVRLYGTRMGVGGQVTVWDAGSGTVLLGLIDPDGQGRDDLAVSRDGKYVALPAKQSVKLWPLALPLHAWTHRETDTWIIKEAAFTPDGSEFVFRKGDGRFVRIDAGTGKELSRRGPDGKQLFPWTLAPAGRGYAGVGKDGLVRFCDATGAESAVASEKIGPLSTLAFDPDGQLLAVAPESGGLLVLDSTGKVLQRVEAGTRGATGVAISAGGKYLAGGFRERGFVLWNLPENRLVCETRIGDGRTILPVFRPGGKHLALACADGVTRIHSTETGVKIFDLRGHTNSIVAVTYSPDGSRLATVGDSTVRIWDADTGQLMLTFPCANSFPNFIVFSSENRRLAVIDSNTVYVYEAP